MIKRQGFVLIIVLVLLGILGYLSINLVSQSQISRQLSLRGVWSTRARLNARSGLERAVQGSSKLLLSTYGLKFHENPLSVGDDRNRNGVQDAFESATDGVFCTHVEISKDQTPSFALEDLAIPGRSQLEVTDGVLHGVSWKVNGGDDLALIQMGQPGLYLNGGVLAGESLEGAKYETRYGIPYSASSATHPFNRPTINMLNAWGNYHKYRAMVRNGKTYNYSVVIDHASNLGATAPGPQYWQNPWGLFDHFNPSGNYAMAGLISEAPLGDRLVAERPMGGYKSLERPRQIVAEYVSSWTDHLGTWKYSDGSDIPEISPAQIKSIQQEFIMLAVCQHTGDFDTVYVPESPSGAVLLNDPPDLTLFENQDTRNYLCQGLFKVDSLRTNLNSAPESLLAATIHSIRQARMMRYQPLDKEVAIMMDAVWCQSENNHPCYYSYGDLHPVISGKPLYSMTESLQLARELTAFRATAPGLQSMAQLKGFLMRWPRGYDAKRFTANQSTRFTSTQPGAVLKNAELFYDVELMNFRSSILFQILNPNANLSSLVWDEALPGRIDNAVMSMTDQQWLERNPKYTYMFDKFMPHERGNVAETVGGCYQIRSLGLHRNADKALGRASLTCVVWPFEYVTISSQKEFEQAAVNPGSNASTLGLDWVSYPESGGPLAEYDGHLALKPRMQICPLGQGAPTLRCTLNGYESNPTQTQPVGYWPAWDRLLYGPNENPARGKFLNSLVPRPGQSNPSLLPLTTLDIDQASDLMPGGGIRMSPWSNSPWRDVDLSAGGHWNRREALMVLRNYRVLDSDDAQYPSKTHLPTVAHPRALPSTREGAVSFYFKPRFAPNRVPYFPTPTVIPNKIVTRDGGHCLFFTNFMIEDQEVKARILNFGSITDFKPYQHYHVQLRLGWGSAPAQPYVPNPGTTIYRFGSLPYKWPYVQPFYISPTEVETHQGGAAPFLFNDMRGFTYMFAGTQGMFVGHNCWPYFLNEILPNGDGVEGHFGGTKIYNWESLVLEMFFSKFADMDPDLYSTDNADHQKMNSFYPTWDSNDIASPVAQRFGYVLPPSNGLYIMETMSPGDLERDVAFHTVRKAFYLSHPFALDAAGSAPLGSGPLDSRKNPQFLIQPGRWNHIFLAWRNMWDLLNDGSPHKGGSLAVYVNGAFKKTSPANFRTLGHFVFQDHSSAFPTDAYPNVTPHNDVGDYANPLSYQFDMFVDKVYTFPEYSSASSTIFNNNRSYFLPSSLSMSQLMDFGYCHPAAQVKDVLKTDLFERFPTRLYFGFEPTTQKYALTDSDDLSSYYPRFITWGSFMDIQVFPRAADALLSPDQGFVGAPNIPGYDSFSVYPNNTTASPTQLFPLQYDRKIKKILGIMWSAYLPEFHNFWDDQGSTPGVDTADSQQLTLNVMQSGVSQGTMMLSQLPTTTPVYHLKFINGLGVGLPGSFSFDLGFSGPLKVNSTPLIDDITIIHQNQHIRFSGITWD